MHLHAQTTIVHREVGTANVIRSSNVGNKLSKHSYRLNVELKFNRIVEVSMEYSETCCCSYSTVGRFNYIATYTI